MPKLKHIPLSLTISINPPIFCTLLKIHYGQQRKVFLNLWLSHYKIWMSTLKVSMKSALCYGMIMRLIRNQLSCGLPKPLISSLLFGQSFLLIKRKAFSCLKFNPYLKTLFIWKYQLRKHMGHFKRISIKYFWWPNKCSLEKR